MYGTVDTNTIVIATPSTYPSFLSPSGNTVFHKKGRLKAAKNTHLVYACATLNQPHKPKGINMNNEDFDLDNLDELLDDFDGVAVEGGVDAENEDDACSGGACKI